MKNAEYYRNYRKQRAESGNPVPSGSRKKSKWETAHFIAWDGEGSDTGREVDSDTPEHAMTLFANSEGSTLYHPERLATIDLLNMLLDSGKKYPHAINVIYGGTYDVTHILYDLSFKHLYRLRKTGKCVYRGVYIRYVPRKYLLLHHRLSKRKIILWDVIGFFQASFVQTIGKWLGPDYPDLAAIEAGKLQRAHFANQSREYIEAYNQKELKALVLICEKLRESIEAAGLQLSRWDGAGAVAAAIYRKHSIKADIVPLPDGVELAARHAYFGGRIECLKFGATEQGVHQYDINSAYPSVLRGLPSLATGTWNHYSSVSLSTVRNSSPVSLFRVRWNVSAIIGPFPFRYENGTIHYPQRGEGWYYRDEIIAAISSNPDAVFDIREAYIYSSPESRYPFSFIDDYYALRQSLISGQTDGPKGLEKVIKLGLNSLYGKLAQNAGYEPEKDIKPPYHSLVYAGAITSSTRAKLYAAAMQAPDSIVMLMTDGVVSLQELELPTSERKILGEWDHNYTTGFVAIQSGIYATRAKDEWAAHSRGIDRTGIRDSDFITRVIDAWKQRKIGARLDVDMFRMIGTRRAAISQEWYARRGSWHHEPRSVELEPGASGKRMRNPESLAHPARELVPTIPSPNLYWDLEKREVISQAYIRPWDRDSEYLYNSDDMADELE